MKWITQRVSDTCRFLYIWNLDVQNCVQRNDKRIYAWKIGLETDNAWRIFTVTSLQWPWFVIFQLFSSRITSLWIWYNDKSFPTICPKNFLFCELLCFAFASTAAYLTVLSCWSVLWLSLFYCFWILSFTKQLWINCVCSIFYLINLIK